MGIVRHKISYFSHTFIVIFYHFCPLTHDLTLTFQIICRDFHQVLITDDFLQRLDRDLDDLTRPSEVCHVMLMKLSAIKPPHHLDFLLNLHAH